mmetsp:Transcript_25417/g.67219  ORF Transcript_25417/g.67219 Transcript_25417/m.67219 type:complete len:708 (+) Transcript_25417:27-2150(+)
MNRRGLRRPPPTTQEQRSPWRTAARRGAPTPGGLGAALAQRPAPRRVGRRRTSCLCWRTPLACRPARAPPARRVAGRARPARGLSARGASRRCTTDTGAPAAPAPRIRSRWQMRPATCGPSQSRMTTSSLSPAVPTTTRRCGGGSCGWPRGAAAAKPAVLAGQRAGLRAGRPAGGHHGGGGPGVRSERWTRASQQRGVLGRPLRLPVQAGHLRGGRPRRLLHPGARPGRGARGRGLRLRAGGLQRGGEPGRHLRRAEHLLARGRELPHDGAGDAVGLLTGVAPAQRPRRRRPTAVPVRRGSRHGLRQRGLPGERPRRGPDAGGQPAAVLHAERRDHRGHDRRRVEPRLRGDPGGPCEPLQQELGHGRHRHRRRHAGHRGEAVHQRRRRVLRPQRAWRAARPRRAGLWARAPGGLRARVRGHRRAGLGRDDQRSASQRPGRRAVPRHLRPRGAPGAGEGRPGAPGPRPRHAGGGARHGGSARGQRERRARGGGAAAGGGRADGGAAGLGRRLLPGRSSQPGLPPRRVRARGRRQRPVPAGGQGGHHGPGRVGARGRRQPLALAGRPRRGGADRGRREPVRERPGGDGRQRDDVRPVRGARDAGPRAVDGRQRLGLLLPVRVPLRRRLIVRGGGLRGVPRGRQRHQPPGPRGRRLPLLPRRRRGGGHGHRRARVAGELLRVALHGRARREGPRAPRPERQGRRHGGRPH